MLKQEYGFTDLLEYIAHIQMVSYAPLEALMNQGLVNLEYRSPKLSEVLLYSFEHPDELREPLSRVYTWLTKYAESTPYKVVSAGKKEWDGFYGQFGTLEEAKTFRKSGGFREKVTIKLIY